jgi:superfamily II DNA or RNA helicase
MRRLFNDGQKKHLYLSAQGRCSRCDEILGERWDAHHNKRYADGGITDITNASPLCQRCHVLTHRRIGMFKSDDREWQSRALDKFEESRTLSFLLDATPGSGKTIFSAFCCRGLLERNQVDFALILVPTTALKGDTHAGFLGNWNGVGIQLTTILKDGKGPPSEYKGAVITYAQLPNIISTIEIWAANGLRIFSVFDEIHHITEDNVWGAAAERLARCSTKILGMTGTPFRGDGRRISFVEYDKDGCARPDFKYSYRAAVKERVCRPVEFMTDDGTAEFIRYQEEEKQTVRLSEASTDSDVRGASNTIFRADSNWLRAVIERAEVSVDEYRTTDADAGCLIVCRAGTDDGDERYLRQVAGLVKDVTGEIPEIISYEDPDANAKIERFRKGKQRFICAVRKISEGVDIKRLRVLVMATRPTTELLFRQLVGRVVRVQNKKKKEYATAYIAKFPQLQEWAANLSEEAKQGLYDREMGDRDIATGERQESSFVALNSTHENGGAVSDYGEEFTAAEIDAAERDKSGDSQLFDIPVTKLAYLRRKFGIVADPGEVPSEPLQIQKKKIRTDINKAARRLAIRRSYEHPDFKRIWIDIHKHTGADNIDDLMDNYSIDVMRQVLQLVHGWLGGEDVAA